MAKRRKKRNKNALPPGPKQPSSLTALRKGVTLASISKKTGINLSHLSYIFNGRSSPSIRTAKRIASFLGVTLDRLYKALPEKSAAK